MLEVFDPIECTCTMMEPTMSVIKGIACTWCLCGQTDENNPSVDWTDATGQTKTVDADLCESSNTGVDYPVVRTVC